MQKARLGETISTSSEASDKMLTFCKHQPNSDFSDLISELTELEHEGNDLLKQSKLEDAKNKFMKGNDKFELVAEKIYNLLTNNDQVEQILSLHKYSLSKIAQCFFAQKKYKEAIEYDLKLLEVSPKFGKSLVRLIKSYSKLNLIEQAVYYGDLFLELDQETRDKFKDAQDTVQEEKQKLKKIKKAEEEKIKKDIAKYSVPAIVLLLAILIFLLFRKK